MEEITPENLLREWCIRIKRAQLAHRFAAKGYNNLHLWMGIPAVALSTLVATSVFASLEEQLEGYGRIIIGMLSVFAAILAALQTFLHFKELSDKHQITDAKYGTIKLKIEQMQVLMIEDKKELKVFFHQVRREIENLAKQAPIIPEKFWQEARAVIAKTAEK